MILLTLVMIPLVKNMFEVQALEQEKSAAKQELEELADHQDDLKYYSHLLQNEDYVAKLARSEYYLTEDDEIVFSFPDDETSEHQEVIK
ncbi:FtsB family cell division protein, partial [Salmonella enterica]|uniref:FtsB family cell division protein n=1 Tax=Salmonella enterica TaxID=28901 RepID=UPI002351F23C